MVLLFHKQELMTVSVRLQSRTSMTAASRVRGTRQERVCPRSTSLSLCFSFKVSEQDSFCVKTSFTIVIITRKMPERIRDKNRPHVLSLSSCRSPTSCLPLLFDQRDGLGRTRPENVPPASSHIELLLEKHGNGEMGVNSELILHPEHQEFLMGSNAKVLGLSFTLSSSAPPGKLK